MQYLLEFGHSPHLALREWSHLCRVFGIKFERNSISEQIHTINSKSKKLSPEFFEQFGGLVRVARLVGTSRPDQLDINLARHVAKNLDQSRDFHLVNLTDGLVDPYQVKHLVSTKHQLASRYINQPANEFVSPKYLVKNQVTELAVLESENNLSIYQTSWCSDSSAWEFFDRQRPFVDAASGILPPKIARMMVNLGRNSTSTSLKLYDPFCGSGTILGQALMLGLTPIGSDISEQAVNQTRLNLEWLSQQIKSKTEINIFKLDFSQTIPKSDIEINCLVAEGYLGPTDFETSQLPEIQAELAQLYQDIVPNINRVLTDNGRLVLALPFWPAVPKPDLISRQVIDTLEKSGYNLAYRPLVYGQPNSQVRRSILVANK